MIRLFLFGWFSLVWLHAASLQLTGSVAAPMTLTPERFAALEQTTLEGVALVCRSGAVKAPPKPRSGVLLRTLLKEAEIVAPGRGAYNRMGVLARAGDGYAALFSYQELTNTPVGEGVIVVYEGGTFALYSARDVVTGPRHVRDLQTVELILINQ